MVGMKAFTCTLVTYPIGKRIKSPEDPQTSNISKFCIFNNPEIRTATVGLSGHQVPLFNAATFPQRLILYPTGLALVTCPALSHSPLPLQEIIRYFITNAQSGGSGGGGGGGDGSVK